MKCCCCGLAAAIFHAPVADSPNTEGVVCWNCAIAYGITDPIPVPRLVPLTPAWWRWMHSKKNRLQEAAHAYMEDDREPA